jgi:DNA-binding IclR family transcriptional regulator
VAADQSSYINSIKRAVKILDLFEENIKFLGITEMARALDLNKSSVYRIVNTLKEEELLIQDTESQKYKLGYKILEIANTMRKQYDHKEIALEEMNKLRDETEEAVMLSVFTNIGGVCIEKVETKNNIKLTSKPGHTTPLHCGATGKILLAYAKKEEIDKVLKRNLESYTENSITDKKKLKIQLKKIRDQGYVISWGEVDKGAIGIGAPILDENGKLLYGLSIAGPEERIKSYGLNKAINKVVTVAEEISDKINLIEVI